jgi:expansin (peptidoglycan-binding protein)
MNRRGWLFVGALWLGAGCGKASDCDPTLQLCEETVGSCEAPLTHTGDGTFYDADGTGNCSFDASPNDLRVAAINNTEYANSAACGACAQVRGPEGEITVRIVDRCPECPPGDLDLSQEAFAAIAPLEAGRVPISWDFVPCEVSGPAVYHFKEGSNPFFTAVQVRNHRNPIATFEALNGAGEFVAVERVEFNFFIEESGLGPGPYTFRVTDIFGGLIEDTNIPFVEAGDVQSASQFNFCTP